MSSLEPVQLAFNCLLPRKEEKAPVIFLHGITVSKEYWNNIPQVVADNTARKVYAVDFRHHGDSPWTETFEFDSNVLDLQHFMDTHKIPKAILVGHSMGGMTAMKFALTMPEKVEKLVVEDATIGRIPPEVIKMLILKLSVSKAVMKDIPAEADEAGAAELLLAAVEKALPPEVRKYVRLDKDSFVLKKTGGKFDFKANIPALESALKHLPTTVPEPEGLYDGPTCFMYGKSSPFKVGSDENLLKRFFPEAEMVGFENAGHTVHNDCPSEFIKVLLDFLQKEDVTG